MAISRIIYLEIPLLYIRNYKSNEKDSIGVIHVYYRHLDHDYYYYLSIDDSIRFEDEFDVSDKCYYYTCGNRFIIKKNTHARDLFGFTNLDSLVLKKKSTKFIEKIERKHDIEDEIYDQKH